MNWFLIALISPALWSICNHIDKYLIGKYFKSGGPGALIIFSSIIGFFVLPFIFLFQPNVLNIPVSQISLVVLVGVISIIAILVYLYALKRDEASMVVPLFQITPVFYFILGFIFLGETLTQRQIVGSLLIILGGASLSLDIENKKPRLEHRIFLLMLFSCFLLAISGLIFKVVALEVGFWTTTFWEYIGAILVSVFFLLFIKNYRKEFIKVIRENNLPVLGLNAFNEIINVFAFLAFRFASLLAPLALVQSVNGFQSLFVFFYGIILTLFFPRFGVESLVKKHLVRKLITIVIMFVGTYTLNT